MKQEIIEHFKTLLADLDGAEREIYSYHCEVEGKLTDKQNWMIESAIADIVNGIKNIEGCIENMQDKKAV